MVSIYTHMMPVEGTLIRSVVLDSYGSASSEVSGLLNFARGQLIFTIVQSELPL